MIISSGQILSGRALNDMPAAILSTSDIDGFIESAYKAVCAPERADIIAAGSSMTKGSWVEFGAKGNDERFLGVIGDDPSPQANIILDTNNPVLGYGEDYNVKAGGMVTFERNGMISVIAGGDIYEGDYLALGDEGTFIVQDPVDPSTAVGRSYGNAQEGQRFEAYIQAL